MSKHDRLWSRYWAIRDQHRNGHAMPILWYLALRHDPMALIELSNSFDAKGRLWDRFSQEGLAYRAYRSGYALGAQHLAMNAFNRSNLADYRRWLAKAVKLGDRAAAAELRRFEVRLPHRNAFLIGRGRPSRNADFA